MQHLGTIRPAPPAPPTGGSITPWLFLVAALAVIVIAGYVLSLRR
jgi:LPXTG-motif cell wall-anchored protein